MSKFGKELIERMQQAAAHAGGRKVPGVRVTTVETPDVKAIRKALHMSQHRFAVLYRIPLPTLKNWEQGGVHPTHPRRLTCGRFSAGRRKLWKPSPVEKPWIWLVSSSPMAISLASALRGLLPRALQKPLQRPNRWLPRKQSAAKLPMRPRKNDSMPA